VALALNLVALILVLALCAAAMGWWHEKVGAGPLLRRRDPKACPTCEGVGAVHGVGPLRPCPDCHGTGERVPS